MKAIGNAHASLDYARSHSRAAFTVTLTTVVTGGFAANTKDTKSPHSGRGASGGVTVKLESAI
jgi:hypothetical protein